MAKKKNVFQRYFENFGLKQICDILMIVSLIVLIVGWILWNTVEIVFDIACGLFALTALIRIIGCLNIIRKESNKRSPERRAAIVNSIIMAVILAAALFGLIWGLTVGFSIPATN